MTEKEKPIFAMDFVGFASMGLGTVEAVLTVSPEFDLKAIDSTFLHKDGCRLITLVFRPSDTKLCRKGYSLKEEWCEDAKAEASH